MSFSARYGPWALVTGAAKGLGAAFADELVARGINVAALDRDAEALAAHVERLREAGAQVLALPIDLADDTMMDDVEAALAGRAIGLLVNNAAEVSGGPFLARDLGALRRELRVNAEAGLLLAHRFGNAMLERGRGGIVFVSSLSMLSGSPVFAHYAATKAYDAVLAQGVYEELRGSGVDVTTVLGPLIDTPGLRDSSPATMARALVSPATVARAALDGLGRTGRVIVGRDGHLVTGLLARLLPHESLRRLVAQNVRKMYPDRG